MTQSIAIRRRSDGGHEWDDHLKIQLLPYIKGHVELVLTNLEVEGRSQLIWLTDAEALAIASALTIAVENK